jgi:hypothetical protein
MQGRRLAGTQARESLGGGRGQWQKRLPQVGKVGTWDCDAVLARGQFSQVFYLRDPGNRPRGVDLSGRR